MEMIGMSEKFEVEYRLNGTVEKIVVRAPDFMAAAKTATERLVVIHSRSDKVEIQSIARAGRVPANAPVEARVDTLSGDEALDALERIAEDLSQDASLRTDKQEWAAKGLWVAVMCLKDAGREVQASVLEAYGEYEHYWFDSYFNIDLNDETRGPLDPVETISDIATALHHSWRTLEARNADRWQREYMDLNEGVEFADNKMIHAYLTAVDTLAAAGKLEKDGYLEHGYNEVFPLYLEANPLSGPAPAR
ncbi:hypothetical protein D3C71_249760 [compost metagenome]